MRDNSLRSGSYALLTPPAIEPVTIAESKAHTRIDIADDDAYIAALITGAREQIEQQTGRSLITQTWTLSLSQWPREKSDHDWWDGVREMPISATYGSAMDIAKSPFQSVSAIDILDEAGNATSWPKLDPVTGAPNWYGVADNSFGRLARANGQAWPVPLRYTNGIRITFTCGYGANASDVPGALRHAIKMLAAHWYENREPTAIRGGASTELPHNVRSLIASFQVLR